MSGLDLSQLKSLIVRPTLSALGLGSESAVNLLTGTVLAESGGIWLKQVGGGPALGLWQMEPFTHDDCWTNWLRFPAQSKAATVIRGMLGNKEPDASYLVSNLRYACAMARIKYYRATPPLPHATDAAGLSAYWKTHYNTASGAGDASANVALFQKAIAA